MTIEFLETKHIFHQTPIVIIFRLHGAKLSAGFVQETRHKNQGLFKDFPASNKIFPGPFILLCKRLYDLLSQGNSRTFKHFDQKTAVFQGIQGLEKKQ